MQPIIRCCYKLCLENVIDWRGIKGAGFKIFRHLSRGCWLSLIRESVCLIVFAVCCVTCALYSFPFPFFFFPRDTGSCSSGSYLLYTVFCVIQGALLFRASFSGDIASLSPFLPFSGDAPQGAQRKIATKNRQFFLKFLRNRQRNRHLVIPKPHFSPPIPIRTHLHLQNHSNCH